MQQQAYDRAVRPVHKLLDKQGLPVTEVRLAGNAGDELASYVRKNKFDLLVLGSHGYGAFKAALLGSTATRVAARCDTPLLLIRDA